MQPAPGANPFSNPTVMILIIFGILLIVAGIFIWPLLIIGVLMLIFGFAWPYVGGMGMTPGGYYQQPYYQAPPQQYPQYPQTYAPQQPMPQQPAPQPAQPAPQPAPQPAYVPPAQPSTPMCPRCGRPVQWVPQYQRWYCPAENVYPWG